MMNMKSRSGSALLIVLGMLAFMVMSSVGFAIYMRQSRVPSSHLRRESTSRYLLKSALANAIARLDGKWYRDNSANINGLEGIYDDPYPGVLPSDYQRGADNKNNGDYWVKRVFMPFGEVDTTETISTLTLEGLAYLPPALINEARVYSRRTRTAKWERLNYDLGRYAFTAIDVSDCFDINKLAADKGGKAPDPRRSSNPSSRITLDSLYPGKGGDLAKKLKTNMSQQIPYVSIADFNVAFGPGEYTPFARLLKSKNGDFYTDRDEATVKNALFITDTWFPATNAFLTTDLELDTLDNSKEGTYFDLSDEADQPYTKSFLANDKKKIEEIPGKTKSGGKTLASALETNLGVGIVSLVDYLDGDSIPTSLALPTTEAVPMVTGINLVGGSIGLSFEKTPAREHETWQLADDGGTLHNIERKVEVVNFKVLGSGDVISGTVTYPFKRMKSEMRTDSYKVEALVAVFFATDGLKCRLADTFRPTEEDWKNPKPRDGIYFLKTEKTDVQFSKDIATSAEATANYTLTINKKSGELMPLMHLVNEDDKGAVKLKPGISPSTIDPKKLEKNIFTFDGISGTRLMAFGNDGKVHGDFPKLSGKPLYTGAERANGNRQAEAKEAAAEYKPYVAVWVRVLAGNDTVDLAPATAYDDAIMLKNGTEIASELGGVSGSKAPILDFKSAGKPEELLSFDDQWKNNIINENQVQRQFEPDGWKSLLCVDPRYNFAPEDWFGLNDEIKKKNDWYDNIKSILGKKGRDKDIFMFVSDQDHLQSIGELAFLPYCEPLGENADSRVGGNFASVKYHGDNNFDERSPSALNGFTHGNYFWKTYSPYDRGESNMNPYLDLKNDKGKRIVVVNGEEGFRVNPYSSDPRVIGAAIKYTPWDYYVASTNDECIAAITEIESDPLQYSWGAKSAITSDRWQEALSDDIAAALADEFRTAAAEEAQIDASKVDWGSVFAEMEWESNKVGDDQKSLFGTQLDYPLHGVDRKFLYSFWRECFQNRQQLFLIFVRAEPMTVGGAGGESLANSQLGARGVALVWRDPLPPKTKSGESKRKTRVQFNQSTEQVPHRTRILFYHQFD